MFLVTIILPLPQESENNSGLASGLPHLELSVTLPSSDIPLVHSGASSIYCESTKPHEGHVGIPSRLKILITSQFLHKFLFTDFINSEFFTHIKNNTLLKSKK